MRSPSMTRFGGVSTTSEKSNGASSSWRSRRCSVRRRRLSWDRIASSLPRVDLREALYTTRAMRRVSDKPIPAEVQARILDAAIRAPSGGNSQTWRFLLVDDQEVMAKLAPIY